MLLAHLSLSFVLLQEQLLNVLLKVQLLVFLGLEQRVFTLLVRVHLFCVLLLLNAEFFFVDSPQILLLFISMLINLLFLEGQLSGCLFKLHFLLLDKIFKSLDLFIVLVHGVL